MRITRRNILYHELVGLEVKILRHPDPSIEGLEGTVYWETERALYVRIPGDLRPKLILKKGALIAFKLPHGGYALVEGEQLIGDPVERAKRARYGV